MIKPGHIEITDKARFVYHELKKPDFDIYERAIDFKIDCIYYKNKIKKYEASKQSVEVSNEYETTKEGKNFLELTIIVVKGLVRVVDNNQKCKAEVNGKAKIIELL